MSFLVLFLVLLAVAPTPSFTQDANAYYVTHRLIIAEKEQTFVDFSAKSLKQDKNGRNTIENFQYKVNTPTNNPFDGNGYNYHGEIYNLNKQYCKKPASSPHNALGDKVVTDDTSVTCKTPHRVVFTHPGSNSQQNRAITTIQYTVVNAANEISKPANITVVGRDGFLQKSNFQLSAENWKVVGNKKLQAGANIANALTEPSYVKENYGPDMSYFVRVCDDVTLVGSDGDDKLLNYLLAPLKFLGDFSIAYGGYISYNLQIFSPALASSKNMYTMNNPKTTWAILLECSGCARGTGITLGVTLEHILNMAGSLKTKGSALVKVRLLETAGWLKDSKNVLVPWTEPSVCDMIEVLQGLTKVKILTDLTPERECVGVDNIAISNLNDMFPLCGVSTKTSKCTC